MTTREGLLYLVLSPYLAMYGGRPWSTRHCVRRGPSYPQKKRAHPLPPNFGPCLLWPNGWMDEDAAWYGSRPRLRPHCTRRGPSSCERGTAPLLFGPCLLWPRSPISAAAELLYIIVIIIIWPHRSTTYVDAAYCYQPSSVVCRSVCHTSEPCKKG